MHFCQTIDRLTIFYCLFSSLTPRLLLLHCSSSHHGDVWAPLAHVQHSFRGLFFCEGDYSFFFFSLLFLSFSPSAEYRSAFTGKSDAHACCHGKALNIYLYIIWDFFCFWPRLLYLTGVEPVALRARFRCVWVFKGFTAEKLFGLGLLRHTSATELCHFWFSTSCWNQRKVQKKSKKYKTKADENRPDWIMSDLAYS